MYLDKIEKGEDIDWIFCFKNINLIFLAVFKSDYDMEWMYHSTKIFLKFLIQYVCQNIMQLSNLG